MDDKKKLAQAVLLLKRFMVNQKVAFQALKKQFPEKSIDVYQDRLSDLFENLNVLMYYDIAPSQLDSVLKFFKSRPGFGLFNEPEDDMEIYGKSLNNLETLLYGQGQLKTFRAKQPVDRSGAAIPWITYPALEFLDQIEFEDCDVLELGAGNSTFFWAGKAKSVLSVETDWEWYDKLADAIPNNVQLIYAEDKDKFFSVVGERQDFYDVIFIDSLKYRRLAAVNAIEKMVVGGLIIFDNSDWYPNCCQIMRDAGFIQIDFHGFGPVNGYTWTTSIFFKQEIKMKRAKKTMRPIGGIENQLEDDQP